MTFAGVNYLAVLIAAVAAWIAGAAWYMSLSKFWLAAAGITPEKMQVGKNNPYAWVPFVLVFVGHLVMAWTLAGIVGHFGMVNVKDGIITGALCWLGFVSRHARLQRIRGAPIGSPRSTPGTIWWCWRSWARSSAPWG